MAAKAATNMFVHHMVDPDSSSFIRSWKRISRKNEIFIHLEEIASRLAS